MARSSVGPPAPPNGNSTVVLNPNRPANPFHPTEEPDWVSVPRSESRLSSFSSISSSPYEHINHSNILSTSASSSAPRKLPPPFDPAALPAKAGRLNLAEEQALSRSLKNKAPPPPPPRRQTSTQSLPQPVPARSSTFPAAPPSGSNSQISSASTSAGSLNKAKPGAPPVARKPAHLVTTSPTNSPPTSEPAQFPAFSANGTTAAGAKPTIPRKPSARVSDLTASLHASRAGAGAVAGTKPTPLTGGMRNTGILPPPLQPERATGSSPNSFERYSDNPNPNPNPNHRHSQSASSGRSTPAGGIGLPGLGKVPERKPVMSAPRSTQQQGIGTAQPPLPARKPTVDLLGDDQPGDRGGWETLKPT